MRTCECGVARYEDRPVTSDGQASFGTAEPPQLSQIVVAVPSCTRDEGTVSTRDWYATDRCGAHRIARDIDVGRNIGRSGADEPPGAAQIGESRDVGDHANREPERLGTGSAEHDGRRVVCCVGILHGRRCRSPEKTVEFRTRRFGPTL